MHLSDALLGYMCFLSIYLQVYKYVPLIATELKCSINCDADLRSYHPALPTTDIKEGCKKQHAVNIYDFSIYNFR